MTGYVRVINKRSDMDQDGQPDADEVVFPVDRTNPVLGNPHILRNKNDSVMRAQVIGLYQQDLDADLKYGGPKSRMISDLADRVIAGEKVCLQCHCKPLPCHGDLIKKAIDQVVDVKLNGKNIKKWKRK